jgi:hypothetical protein
MTSRVFLGASSLLFGHGEVCCRGPPPLSRESMVTEQNVSFQVPEDIARMRSSFCGNIRSLLIPMMKRATHFDPLPPLEYLTAEDKVESRLYCENLANKLTNVKDLPLFCRQYKPVVQKLQTKSNSVDATAFEGMRPGEAAAAKAARVRGLEHHAQVQRRLTSGARTGVRRFSKLEK